MKICAFILVALAILSIEFLPGLNQASAEVARPKDSDPLAINKYDIALIRRNELVEVITRTGAIVYIFKDADTSVQMEVVPAALSSSSTPPRLAK
jgi:hypothetical protein